MEIKIEEGSDHFRADLRDLPGSPPVGLGATKEMAVAHLFYRLLHNSDGAGGRSYDWLRHLKKSDKITINGEEWKLPESYKCDTKQ